MTTDDGPLSWEKFRREPATSALVWSFAPLRSSHKRVAAQHCCGRPALFAAPSSWPRKDRALSGRPGRAPPLGRLYGLALAAPFAWSLVTRPAVALLGPCFKTGGAPAFIHSSTHVIVRVSLPVWAGHSGWTVSGGPSSSRALFRSRSCALSVSVACVSLRVRAPLLHGALPSTATLSPCLLSCLSGLWP